jgi:O-methyltransferase involved in polyketide biosynthesis
MKTPILNDPMAAQCLDRLISGASKEDRRWLIWERRLFGGIQAHHARDAARRAKVFDDAANHFIADHPQCTVVNLAGGLDTRFWRIDHQNCRYVEIDLPEVAALKRDILKDQLGYRLISSSVLDAAWINQVTANGNGRFLFLAEGLLSAVPEADVAQLFRRLAQRFNRSQIIFDLAPEKYSKGFWKKLLDLETKVLWGVEITRFEGIRHPREVEKYAPGLKVLGKIKGSVDPVIAAAIHEG